MLVAIYAPVAWKEKWDFYQELTKVVKEGQTEGYKVVVAGNLNVMIDYADRATGGISQQKVGIQKEICQLLTEWGVQESEGRGEWNRFTYHYL